MSTNASGPAVVMIIRHGEKLGDASSDEDGGPNLSVQGSARAAALPSLFQAAGTNGQPQLDCEISENAGVLSASYNSVSVAGPVSRFSTPDFIIATANSKNSHRPAETATPTAVALGNPFDCTTYSDSTTGIGNMTNAILSEAAYTGKVVLICWHHGTIPAVAQGLGVTSPPPWNGTEIFDRVWVIDFSITPLAVNDQPQQLLYLDTET